jgi:uncharacterized membrane protein
LGVDNRALQFVECSAVNDKIMTTSNKIVSAVLIAAILICTGLIIYLAVTPQASQRFSEFYILNRDGKASGYPSQAVSGQPVSIIVGVVNHEAGPSRYTIQIKGNDAIIKSIEVGELKDGQKWEQPVEFVLNTAGDGCRVNFYLYKDGGAVPHIKDPLVLIMKVTEN